MSDKEKTSFESALHQLEQIVQRLEGGDVTLDEALELFSEGVRLSKICSNRLDFAEKKMQLLLNDEEGNPVLKETSDFLSGGNQ